MSQRADRELDRLLQIARPEASSDFTDDVMSRIAATDDPMPIAPAIIFPFRARRFPPPPPPSLFVRTAIVTAPLVAMLALVFVLASSLFTDKGTERRRPDDSSAVRPDEATDLAAEVKRLEDELVRSRTALNAAEPHDMEGKRRCSMCHDVARLASIRMPSVLEQRGGTGDRLEVVAFVDLDAPSGPAMMQAIETMALKFSDKVAIEIRNPRTGSTAARASVAAAQQGAYWQMVECLAEYGTGAVGIDACADEAKLDRFALEQTMYSDTVTAALDADRDRARSAGVTGPSIVIGDRVFSGPRAHVDAREFVNAALARRTL